MIFKSLSIFPGGTVDITVHKILKNGKVAEVVAASGGAAGGTNVNAALTEFLRKLWNDNFIRSLQSESSRHWLSIEHSFGKAKRSACPSSTTNVNLFSVTMPIYRKYKEATGVDAEKSFVNNRLGLIFNEDDSIVAITPGAMSDIFKPTVDEILKCAGNVLRQRIGIKYIFMVGGFSTSKYLTEAVRKAFGDKVKVLIPEDPALAVLKGAVQFGWKPDFVRTRIARKTYGIAVDQHFNDFKHRIETKHEMYSNEYYSKDVFSTFIRKNSTVELDSSEFKTYTSKHKEQEITFRIFSSESENPAYVNDEDACEIGRLCIPAPVTSASGTREFGVTFYFGRTEITVTVKELGIPGAVEKTTRIDFSAS